MTDAQIREEIARLEAQPRFPGVEFDATRVNHMRKTTINTFREILAERAAQAEPIGYGTFEGDTFKGFYRSKAAASRFANKHGDTYTVRPIRDDAELERLNEDNL
jgi:hypothetical protein